jgi:hypothetical protein
MTASATYKFNFSLFTIEGPVHAADPSLTEAEIRASYDSLIARDGLLPNPDPPLNKTEMLIRDTIIRLANEQYRARAQ